MRSIRWSSLVVFAWLVTAVAPTPAATVDDAAWSALRRGAIVLLRHATAPGIGDPAGFRLDDCATQRNLDRTGRAEAARIGAAFRAHGVMVGAVRSSEWCRTRETAELAFPGRSITEPVFDSFFDDSSNGAAQTAAARALLQRWKGPGALVVVTHQVNITALTGIVPAAGEGIVVDADGAALRVVGKIATPP